MKLAKVRNVILVVLVCAVLALPCCTACLQKINPSFSLPAFLDQQKVKFLAGGNASIAPLGESFTIDRFVSGDLQKNIEASVNEAVPGRYYALLSYSASQRSFIELSNAFFKYEAFPARYSAENSYIPENNALSGMPLHYSSQETRELFWVSDKIADLAKAYPEKHFCIIVADTSNTSSIQPSFRLMTEKISTADIASLLGKSCSGITNVTISANTYSDLGSYYDDFYTTDHHWNGWGALSAYNQAVRSIESEQQTEIPSLEIDEDWEKIEGFEWLVENGSYSRTALMLLNEPVNEPKIPLDGVTVISNTSQDGKDTQLPKLINPNGIDTMKYNLASEFSFYETWYGGGTNTVIVNQNSDSNKSALVIGDSYASAFKWIAATKFAQITSLPNFRGDTQQVTPIREILDSTNSDYIFLVASPQNYVKTAEKFPNYFD